MPRSWSFESFFILRQERTGRYLEQLCAGTTLALSATRPASAAKGRAGAPEIDKITKTVTVRPPAGADGEVRHSMCFHIVVFSRAARGSHPLLCTVHEYA